MNIKLFRKNIFNLLRENLSVDSQGNLNFGDTPITGDDLNHDNDPIGGHVSGMKMPSVEDVKYFLNDLPAEYKKILYAPDLRIFQEYDQPTGILSAFSKQLNKHFDFSYNSQDFDDWTVFIPGQ